MALPLSDNSLSPRSLQVLRAVVESYIRSGEPVASSAVALQFGHSAGMGPATLRNVMVELSEVGLLEQPHTSAGRVPTARAFRLYAQQVLASAPAQADGAVQMRLHDGLAGIERPHDFLERASQMLAGLSSGMGVAINSAREDAALEHIHFSRVAPNRVLAVVVMRSGVIRDRVLRLDRDVPSAELDAAARYLNSDFRGETLDNIRAELARRLDAERSAYDRMLQGLRELRLESVFESPRANADVFVDGVANLVAHSPDRERLTKMLAAIEERQRLVELLNAYVSGTSETVRVVVGLEDTMPHMEQFVLVAAPARLDGEAIGTVAVIGTTRMQYGQTIGAVQYAARLYEQLMRENAPAPRPGAQPGPDAPLGPNNRGMAGTH